MINAETFWSQAEQVGECLLWTGQTNAEPVYGIFSALGGRLIAHRVAYELSVGNLPQHSHVGRTCNNPLCIAPKHLYLQNPSKSENPTEDIKRKIAAQVEVADGCWLWRGKAPKCISISSGLKTLPRAVYEVYHGPIARGKEVSRTCQQPKCLNPEHLTLIDKSCLGKSNSKLTLEQVQEIRTLALTGEYGLIELAEKFHTSRQTIYTVVYNLGWHDSEYQPPAKMPRRPRTCRQGHPLSGDNILVLENGARRCKVCKSVVDAVKKPRKSLSERFWEKVYKHDDGCWDWTAYNHKGWGYFNIDRIPQLSHRVAYELSCGPVPAGARVLHSCNNDLCCNPAHLYVDDRLAAK
jgi:hypothetical protein